MHKSSASNIYLERPCGTFRSPPPPMVPVPFSFYFIPFFCCFIFFIFRSRSSAKGQENSIELHLPNRPFQFFVIYSFVPCIPPTLFLPSSPLFNLRAPTGWERGVSAESVGSQWDNKWRET